MPCPRDVTNPRATTDKIRRGRSDDPCGFPIDAGQSGIRAVSTYRSRSNVRRVARHVIIESFGFWKWRRNRRSTLLGPESRACPKTEGALTTVVWERERACFDLRGNKVARPRRGGAPHRSYSSLEDIVRAFGAAHSVVRVGLVVPTCGARVRRTSSHSGSGANPQRICIRLRFTPFAFTQFCRGLSRLGSAFYGNPRMLDHSSCSILHSSFNYGPSAPHAPLYAFAL